ncbi:ATP-binding protein [Arachidicoccus ginsenosidivorans]
MELDSDLNKLRGPESFLRRQQKRLLIIDEVQRKPELFKILRGLIDIHKRAGESSGQFLLLGSASRDLLQQSSETLAGRIRYMELCPFSAAEIYNSDPLGYNNDKLWFRGGFPGSYLAENDNESWQWRADFISTYVERDIPLMGPKVSAMRLKRFWTMLAHYQGQQVVTSDLGKSLGVSHTTIKSYMDILTDFYMIRQIQPWSGNSKKRLVKTPKTYLRDTGLLHSLLNISNFESLLGHPIIGVSWEGFVIENIISKLSNKWRYSYYRTTGKTEVDLVLETPNNELWAIEIKRSSAPTVGSGYYNACEDMGATHKFVIYPGTDHYPLGDEVEVMGLIELVERIVSVDG